MCLHPRGNNAREWKTAGKGTGQIRRSLHYTHGAIAREYYTSRRSSAAQRDAVGGIGLLVGLPPWPVPNLCSRSSTDAARCLVSAESPRREVVEDLLDA